MQRHTDVREIAPELRRATVFAALLHLLARKLEGRDLAVGLGDRRLDGGAECGRRSVVSPRPACAAKPSSSPPPAGGRSACAAGGGGVAAAEFAILARCCTSRAASAASRTAGGMSIGVGLYFVQPCSFALARKVGALMP